MAIKKGASLNPYLAEGTVKHPCRNTRVRMHHIRGTLLYLASAFKIDGFTAKRYTQMRTNYCFKNSQAHRMMARSGFDMGKIKVVYILNLFEIPFKGKLVIAVFCSSLGSGHRLLQDQAGTRVFQWVKADAIWGVSDAFLKGVLVFNKSDCFLLPEENKQVPE